jgi:hypothetical protein
MIKFALDEEEQMQVMCRDTRWNAPSSEDLCESQPKVAAQYEGGN